MTSTAEVRPSMPRGLAEKMETIAARLRGDKEERAARLAEQGFSPACLAQLVEEAGKLENGVVAQPPVAGGTQPGEAALPRGMSSARWIEKAQLSLLEGEKRGDYKLYSLDPSSEYPTLLTRVPIFSPGQRKKLRARMIAEDLDGDLAMNFETSWGAGKKYGPPLTVYDEDTLLAIMGLRQQQVVGAPGKMPFQIRTQGWASKEASVQVLFTTVGEIEDYLKLPRGGRGHNRRLASVKRLAATVIEFTKASDKAVNSVVKAGSWRTTLIDLLTEETQKESFLAIQLPPVMVLLLSKSYTYVDLEVRRRLTDHGKALHRFLSGQPQFSYYADTLQALTGSKLAVRDFMKVLRHTMETLKEIGWCEYVIEGNGRSKPYKLTGYRSKRHMQVGEQGMPTEVSAA